MRLVTYDTGGAPRAGLQLVGYVADLEKAARAAGLGKLPSGTRELLSAGDKARRAAARLAKQVAVLARKVGAGKERRPAWLLPEERVHLGPPVPNPEKVICIGQNYLDHIREQEGRLGHKMNPGPDPIFFTKFPSTLTGPYDPVVMPPASVTDRVDFEVELALVIGRTIKGIRQNEALEAVAGYMVMNDVSARDCQHSDRQWSRAKSFDTFGPCGPCLVSPDEIADPQKLKLWTVVNGQKLQDGTTSDMLFKIPRLIAHVAAAITLKPGDIISTGTPAGVGNFREPPILLAPGDTVECGIEQVGTICNTFQRD